MPGYSGGPVVTMLVCFIYFAHEAAGALGARHSPRPRFSWAKDTCITRAHRAARSRRLVYELCRHPREKRGSSIPRRRRINREAAAYWIVRSSRTMTAPFAKRRNIHCHCGSDYELLRGACHWRPVGPQGPSQEGTHISTSRERRSRALPIHQILCRLPKTGRALHRPVFWGGIAMKLGTAIAEIMKREGIEILCGYPVNHLIEHAASADIRPVMVRQERIGLHMADAISRVTSGRTIGAFCMQRGPGAENAMGGVAQCYGESVPVLVLPMGYARRLANIEPNFNSSQAMKAFSKSAEPINVAAEVGNIFRRAFTKLKNGRGGPVIVEIPADMWNEEVPEPLNYTPVLRTRYGADPLHVKEAAALLIGARRPVIYAGQGVHYAQAWPQLKRLAERLAIPVTTSLGGKSSFPETHPLSLGSGGLAVPRAVPKFLAEA